MEGVVSHEGPQVHLLGGLFQLPDLGLLLHVLLHALLIAPLLFHGVEAVIPAVKLRLAVQDLYDAGDGAVEKVAVMGDGDDGAAKFGDVLLQPHGGLQIQMVRRLVQQEDVRVLQNEAAKVHPRLLPAGKLRKQPPAHVFVNGEAAGHLAHRRVRVPAAQSLKAGVQVAVAPEGGGAAVPCGHFLRQRVHLLLHGLHSGKGGAQHLLHGVLRRIDGDLGDKPQPLAGGDDHLAGVVVQLSGEDLEQGGLSGAVAAQKPHPLAGVDLKGQAVLYFLFQVKGLYQSRHADVDHAFSSSSTIFSKCMAWEAFTSATVPEVNSRRRVL